eukprot:403355582
MELNNQVKSSKTCLSKRDIKELKKYQICSRIQQSLDCLQQIFSFLSQRELLRIQNINKDFYNKIIHRVMSSNTSLVVIGETYEQAINHFHLCKEYVDDQRMRRQIDYVYYQVPGTHIRRKAQIIMSGQNYNPTNYAGLKLFIRKEKAYFLFNFLTAASLNIPYPVGYGGFLLKEWDLNVSKLRIAAYLPSDLILIKHQFVWKHFLIFLIRKDNHSLFKVFAFNMRSGVHDQYFPQFPTPILEIQQVYKDKEHIHIIGTEKLLKIVGKPIVNQVKYRLSRLYPNMPDNEFLESQQYMWGKLPVFDLVEHINSNFDRNRMPQLSSQKTGNQENFRLFRQISTPQSIQNANNLYRINQQITQNSQQATQEEEKSQNNQVNGNEMQQNQQIDSDVQMHQEQLQQYQNSTEIKPDYGIAEYYQNWVNNKVNSRVAVHNPQLPGVLFKKS